MQRVLSSDCGEEKKIYLIYLSKISLLPQNLLFFFLLYWNKKILLSASFFTDDLKSASYLDPGYKDFLAYSFNK